MPPRPRRRRATTCAVISLVLVALAIGESSPVGNPARYYAVSVAIFVFFAVVFRVIAARVRRHAVARR